MLVRASFGNKVFHSLLHMGILAAVSLPIVKITIIVMNNSPDCHFRYIVSLVFCIHAQFLRCFIGVAIRYNAPDRRVAIQLVNVYIVIFPREIFHAPTVRVAAVGRVFLPVLRSVDNNRCRKVMRVNRTFPCQKLCALAAFGIQVDFIQGSI